MDNDIYEEFALTVALAPIIAGGMMLWCVEALRDRRMENPWFTVEQLRQLIAMRHIIRKILRGPNPDKEIIAWAMRGGKAEVIDLDQFRTDRQRASRQDAAGSSP